MMQHDAELLVAAQQRAAIAVANLLAAGCTP
jgi:hypothetical protein